MKDFRRLFPYLKPYLPLLSFSLVLLTVAGALEVLTTSLAAPIFDGVLAAKGTHAVVVHKKFNFLYKYLSLNPSNILWKISLALALLTLLKGAGLYFANYFMGYVGQSVIMRLRNILYQHLINQSVGFFTLNATGRLMSRVTNDVERLQEVVSVTLTEFVRESILLLLLVGYIFYIDWRLAGLAMIIAPAALFLTVAFGRKIRRVSSKSQESIADISNVLQETITGNRIVKAFGMEDFETRKFLKATVRLRSENLKSIKIMALSSPAMEFLGVVCFIPLLIYAHSSIVGALGRGALTVGAFSAFLFALFRMYDPIRKLSRIHMQFQQAFAASSRVFDMLDTHIEIKDRPDAVALPRIKSAIEFNNVSFHYDGSNDTVPALRNISLRVQAGRIIAVVGSSGSGKTTLVNLLPRFYDATSGSITIDGRDIRDVTLESLRSQISVVTQETFLFNDTVRNNIAYGRPNVSEQEITQAAMAALAHDFIMQLPQGYDTIIGERGQRLSGGERQRVSIARAILKDAPILILDEATSALDSESEKLVQAALANLIKDRTTFVIAHRLSTIRLADLIVVLEDGEIKEIGTHSDLIHRNGIYHRLYELQFADTTKKQAVR